MEKTMLWFFLGMILSYPFSLGYTSELKVERARPLMGTLVEIKVFREASSLAQIRAGEVIERAFEEISRIDRLMSIYKNDSQISLINQQAGKGYVGVSPEVLQVIKKAREMADLSQGAFDITIAPLVQLWGFTQKNGHRPPEIEIRKILPLVNYKNIMVDEENRSIKLKLSGMSLDLGGIAKGYAVDRAVAVLRDCSIYRALVNAGGDLFALGHPPNKDYWHIGIRNPFVPGRIVGRLKIRDQAVATSGNYENFFLLEGKRYSHILDPRTGYPIQGIASVTILAKTTMEADALATIVAVLGPEKGIALLNSLPDTEGIIILDSPQRPYYLLSQGLEGKLSLNF
jgi:thiamine biosynthesis lipoprotein